MSINDKSYIPRQIFPLKVVKGLRKLWHSRAMNRKSQKKPRLSSYIVTKSRNNMAPKSKNNTVTKSRNNMTPISMNNTVTKSRNNTVTKSKNNTVTKSKNNTVTKSKNNTVTKSKNNTVKRTQPKQEDLFELESNVEIIGISDMIGRQGIVKKIIKHWRPGPAPFPGAPFHLRKTIRSYKYEIKLNGLEESTFRVDGKNLVNINSNKKAYNPNLRCRIDDEIDKYNEYKIDYCNKNTDEQVKKRLYRKIALITHPDKNLTCKEKANSRFIKICD